MTDDEALATEVRQACGRLPKRTDADDRRVDAFSLWHTQLYNRHYGKDLDLHIGSFVDTALTLRDATLTRYPWNADGVAKGLENFAENVLRRRTLAAQFFDMVKTRLPAVRCHYPPGESVPWRANVFLPGRRDGVLRTLLAESVRISSWYPPAQDFLAPAWSGDTPIARRVGEEILNVWVNDEADSSYLESVVGRIVALTGNASQPIAE